MKYYADERYLEEFLIEGVEKYELHGTVQQLLSLEFREEYKFAALVKPHDDHWLTITILMHRKDAEREIETVLLVTHLTTEAEARDLIHLDGQMSNKQLAEEKKISEQEKAIADQFDAVTDEEIEANTKAKDDPEAYSDRPESDHAQKMRALLKEHGDELSSRLSSDGRRELKNYEATGFEFLSMYPEDGFVMLAWMKRYGDPRDGEYRYRAIRHGSSRAEWKKRMGTDLQPEDYYEGTPGYDPVQYLKGMEAHDKIKENLPPDTMDRLSRSVRHSDQGVGMIGTIFQHKTDSWKWDVICIGARHSTTQLHFLKREVNGGKKKAHAHCEDGEFLEDLAPVYDEVIQEVLRKHLEAQNAEQ
jgi:hypothetical protein